MRITWNKFFLMLTLVLVFVQPANAYLDPGTGSYIIQIAIATFAGAVFALKMFWNNIKTFFMSIFSKKSDKESN